MLTFRTYYLLIVILFTTSLATNAQDNRLSKFESKQGWKLLFDGKTSKGWRGAFLNGFPANGWIIKNGLLQVQSSNGAESSNGGDIVTIGEYDNFELKLDFKLTKGANSGVKYLVNAQQPAPASPRSAFGLEYQLLDDANHPDAKLGKNGNRTIASLYDLIPAIDNKTDNGPGNWNNLRIISNNYHVEHWLNGVMVLTYERDGKAFLKLIAESKYKDIPGFGLNEKGRILLQDHGNGVFFKNIKVREIKQPDNAPGGRLLKDTPGVVSFTYRQGFQKDFEATLDEIKALGITNIEFSNLFGKTANDIKQLLDDRKMRCTSFGVSYDDLVKKIDEVGRNAKTLGASFVRVAWIPHDSTIMTIAIAKAAVNDFNNSGKVLKDKFGLTLCYHNHGFDMQPFEGGTYFDYLVMHTNPEFVSFELDILWAFHPGKDPVELLNKYPDRFKLMHIKDLRKGVPGDLSGATPIQNDVAVGSGQINIHRVIKAAQRTGIKYYYIEDESNAAKLQVPISLSVLKNL